jgi:hypothetical protein
MLFVAIAFAIVIVPMLLVLYLRGWGLQQSATESRLTSARTPTVTYLVPDGQDPAVVRAALAHAHVASVVGRGADAHRLTIECDESERERVRQVIGQVGLTGFDGVTVPSGRVRFEDDPA